MHSASPVRACSRSTAATGWSHPIIKPRLVTARGRLTETPVTGDWVALDDGGAIAALRAALRHDRPPRARRGDGGQVLAANVDLALVTEPLPEPKARRLERFAALAASGGVPVALVLTKADLDEDGYQTAAQLARRMGVADAVAVSAENRRGDRRAAAAARARAPPRSCSARPAPASRRWSTPCSARSARRRARSARRRARPPHHGHPRAAHAARRRVPDRHARDPGRGALGRHGRELRRRRRARGAVPVRGLRPRERAGLRGPRRSSTRSGSRPGASSSASSRGSRTAGLRPARARRRARDLARSDTPQRRRSSTSTIVHCLAAS